MGKNHVVESVFEHEGLDCVVLFLSMGHRCGYVGVPKDNHLYGVGYNDDLESKEVLTEIKDTTIGKRGVVPVFFWDGERTSPDIVFNVHGGLTYSGGNGKYPIEKDSTWWFGFDCAHCDDARDWAAVKKHFNDGNWRQVCAIDKKFPTGGRVRTLDYVEQECRNLVEQIQCVSQLLGVKDSLKDVA